MVRLIALFLVLFLAGCGYKPMRSYTQEVLGERVYVYVKVFLRDPRNAIFIKNAVHEAVLERFGSRLAKKEDAQTQIEVRIKRIDFRPLEYDKYGYVVYYRTTTALEFLYKKGEREERFLTSGYYDFPIESNSVITDTLRFLAIKESANKAIDQFIARLSCMGVH